MDVLITGSSGLIGSEAVEYFARLGHQVHGIDNNMRADFFGPQGGPGVVPYLPLGDLTRQQQPAQKPAGTP